MTKRYKIYMVLLMCVFVLITSTITLALRPPLDIRAPVETNWQMFKGQSIKLSMLKHPTPEALVKLIPLFEKITGMKIDFSILPEEEYWDKMLVDLASGKGEFSIIFSDPQNKWEYGTAGWIMPLDDFIENPELTNLLWYNLDDFFPARLKSQMWTGEIGKGQGRGKLWGIPLGGEGAMLAFRADLFKKYGLTVPKTYPQLYETAVKLQQAARNDGMKNFIGIITRGNRSWGAIQGGALAMFSSCGVKDFDENLNSTIDTDRAVWITDLYVRMMREAGPPDWTNVTWYDAKQRFTAGLAGMIMDNTFFAASFEDPETSEVAGKVGYAPVPAGPEGKIVTNLASWALAINSRAPNPKAAWLLIELATSRDIMLKACYEYRAYMPSRLSVWYDPRVIAQSREWGVGEWKLRKVADDNMFTGRSRVVLTPTPAYAAQGDLWMTAIQEIHQGAPVKATLSKYAQKIEEHLEEIGLRKHR